MTRYSLDRLSYLPVSCLVWGNPVLKSAGFYGRAIGDLQKDSCRYTPPRTAAASAPSLRQAATNPYLHGKPSNTHRQVWLSLLWGHWSFLLGPGGHKVLFVPSKSLCFPQSCRSAIIKSLYPSKSDSLGVPSPWDSPGKNTGVGSHSFFRGSSQPKYWT